MGRSVQVPRVAWCHMFNPITSEQIIEVITNAINVYYDGIGSSERCKSVIRACIVKFNYGYVFISDQEEFNMVVGLNRDGSSLSRMIEDPNWEPKEETVPFFEMSQETSWASLLDDDDEAPMIEVIDPPLVTLEQYKFTDEQKKEYSLDSDAGNIQLETSRYTSDWEENTKKLSIKVLEGIENFTPQSLFFTMRQYIKGVSRGKKSYPKIAKGTKENTFTVMYADEDEALVTYFMNRYTHITSTKGTYLVSIMFAPLSVSKKSYGNNRRW